MEAEELNAKVEFSMEAEELNAKVEFSMEAEEAESEDAKTKRGRARRRLCDDSDSEPSLSTKTQKFNGVVLAKAMPSYCLKRGIGSARRDFTSIRSIHRKKLRRLLQVLLRRHNWTEASGVLSVLHIATSKEIAIRKTRAKFSATLEVLKHLKGDSLSLRKIQNVYGMWMSKLGPMKKWPIKNKVAVQLEHTVFCLTRKEMDGAYQAALSLMQERGFESDPISNLVVGLTFYELWYSSLPAEMHLGKQEELESNTQPEISQDNMFMSIVDSKWQGASEGKKPSSLITCDSNTSIRNDKEYIEAGAYKCGEVHKDVEINLREIKREDDNQPQDISLHSDERSELEMSNDSSPPSFSSYYTRGLPPLLLPIQFPQLENLEELYDFHTRLRNDQYNSAVMYLSRAFSLMPPALEAFHPLVQLLLLGDKVNEALAIVEKISSDSSTTLHLRLKAHLLEHFDRYNYTKHATCYEDILHKDPTCDYSLGKLISLHQRGDYCTEKLAEIIASNLDATYAKCNTWREFACLLMKLSQAEGDTMSVCADGGDGQKQKSSGYLCICVPRIFLAPESQKSWMLRCKWWLTRHFRKSTLVSDISSGDTELLTYKAAAACHLYGRDFGYVVQAKEFLEKENNMDMLLTLNRHVHNSAGFYLKNV
ncbi:unnamed protein product [Cuscuta epithymum]|uniref:Uncharacterized protein n=1 Tax=Cuscuta epithymum TaxID=186058 RepID=A0AAV0DSG9_9ASTE|nr:unnamed protein product [Cuscuta epithymum]